MSELIYNKGDRVLGMTPKMAFYLCVHTHAPHEPVFTYTLPT